MSAFIRTKAFSAPQGLTLVWGLLLALTLLSFRVGPLLSGRWLMLLVLTLALLKAQLIIDHFMGLRHVHRLWRLGMGIYLASVGALIATAWLIT